MEHVRSLTPKALPGKLHKSHEEEQRVTGVGRTGLKEEEKGGQGRTAMIVNTTPSTNGTLPAFARSSTRGRAFIDFLAWLKPSRFNDRQRFSVKSLRPLA